MTCTLMDGHVSWEMVRDEDGHRDYKVKYLVRADTTDGPANVIRTPGLPGPGTFWQIDDDEDLWAWRKWNATVKVHKEKEGDPSEWWIVEMLFSTKPPKNCKDAHVEDPILEPQRLSGSFSNYNEEATRDRHGRPILTSSHEVIRGPQVEFDKNRAQIKVEQNVLDLEIALWSPMVDTVNDDVLWGMPRRTIKLSNVSWDRKHYGQCYFYYARTFTFDVRFETFDRDLLDEGTKALNGHWEDGLWVLDNIDGAAPQFRNPNHFKRFTDRDGNPCRVILNGEGLPAGIILALPEKLVSIQDGNQGESLHDDEWWISLNDVDDPPKDWILGADYRPGDVVKVGSKIYLSIEHDPVDYREEPPGPEDHWQNTFDPHPERWLELPDGITDRGDWSEDFVYNTGDYVNDTEKTSAGRIHVEKYDESNFLLLGIPTVL
jgi:hypothetical protein